MGVVAASAWYLAQRLRIKQSEDIGTTISVSVSFHLPMRDALILDFIFPLARQSRPQSSTGGELR
jgi:hypothetical protein